MFPSLAVSVFLAASTLVRASPLQLRGKSGNCASGLLAQLNQLGLTRAENSLQNTIEGSGGSYLCDLFQSQAISLLVPQNAAFDPDHPSIGYDPLSLWSYSVMFGTPEDGFKLTNTTFTRRGASQSRSSASSGLNWPPRSSRKRSSGDGKQVQIVDQLSSSSKKRGNDGPLIVIDRPVGSAMVIDRAKYKNIDILVVDRLFTLPTTVSDLLCKPLVSSAPNGFVKFGKCLQNAGLLDDVDGGFKSTVFAPIDQGFDNSGISDYECPSIVKNHFFFGTIVYSTLFTKIPQATAESGKQLQFSYQDGVHYVSCGSCKSIILRSDVTTKWGVLHVIDKPLKCDY